MNDTALRLPDPREYPASAPSNMLIHYAGAQLAAKSDDEAALQRESLRGAIADYLERGEVLPLSVALAMVTSRPLYQVLWDGLRAAVEDAPGRRALVFALPLVLVAGSQQPAELPAAVDGSAIAALLVEHGVIAAGAELTLSGQLLHPDQLSELGSPELYRYARQPEAARELLQRAGTPVRVDKDGVFLRYLLGVAVHDEADAAPVRLGGTVSSWGIPLMKLLGEQLKTAGVTLFPIARPPQPLLQAMVVGGQARQEVALQVFASSQIRRLRDLNLDPVAILAAHQGGELRYTVSAEGDERNWEGFVWRLSPLDRVDALEAMFRELMDECRVRDVRIVDTVQPDQVWGVPYFITADEDRNRAAPQ